MNEQVTNQLREFRLTAPPDPRHSDAELTRLCQALAEFKKWELKVVENDTTGFEPNPSGNGLNVPSSEGKHTIERLTLNENRTRIRYEVTVTDPVYLSEPATMTQQWDHRPDLPFSPASEVCDHDVAARYRDHLPE